MSKLPCRSASLYGNFVTTHAAACVIQQILGNREYGVLKTSDVLKKLSDAYENDALVSVVVLAKWHLVEFPNGGPTWLQLGSALRRLACTEESVSALLKASSLIRKDKLYLVHYEMGLVYRDQGKNDIACQWFQKIIDLKPSHTVGYILYGSSLARQGKLGAAEDLYRTALDCNEGDIDEVYCNIGLVQRAQGKLGESKISFEQALVLDPDYRFVKTQLADVTEAISLKQLLNV